MIPVLSREESRAFDAAAVQRGIPSVVLMENAGRGAADVIEATFGARDRKVVVICGTGNNGGDGFVVARRLRARGAEVGVVLLGGADRLKGDALLNHRAWLAVGGSVLEETEEKAVHLAAALTDVEVAVDAIFGTGLAREIQGLERRAIELFNRSGAHRVALDLPSGIDADRGVELGIAVRAKLTITFGHHKRGLLTPSGRRAAGQIERVDIGVSDRFPGSPSYTAQLVEAFDVAAAIQRRSTVAHKASSGRVLVIAGSPGKIGAALLTAHGALRAGAGLVTIASRPESAAVLEQRVLEAMTLRIDPSAPEASLAPYLEVADTVAIGPGIGLDEIAERIVDHVVLDWDGFKVVDADALTHFKGGAEELAKAKGRLVLTPHPGEMARLLGISTAEVEEDRYSAVERLVKLTGSTVLLKGAHTLVGAPGARIAVNPTGSSVLATGGTGDVLCGMLAAFGVDLEPRLAALSSAYVHGKAGELWAARHHAADRGLLAHEVADLVPDVLAELAGSIP